MRTLLRLSTVAVLLAAVASPSSFAQQMAQRTPEACEAFGRTWSQGPAVRSEAITTGSFNAGKDDQHHPEPAAVLSGDVDAAADT